MRRLPALVTTLATALCATVTTAKQLAGPTRSTDISFAGADQSLDGYERASVNIR